MRVLLVRPICPNERFGLGPYFRVEPLGMEYIASALLKRGHEVKLADLRFGAPLGTLLRRFRPRLVGIANMHTVDIPAALEVARDVKRYDRSIFTLMGGHSAAAFPTPHLNRSVDAISVEDGEATVPALAQALELGRPIEQVPGLLVRQTIGGNGDGVPRFERTPARAEPISLDEVPQPARHLVAPVQKHYLVVQKNPLWGLETARGCPFRCSFCSIWRLMGRTFRFRGVDAVCEDARSCGHNLFIVDDLFWHPRKRSLELGEELVRRGIRKDWILVQTRLDTVARNAPLLDAWRPFSREFDIFFGFEAPTDKHLERLDKDFDIANVEEGVRMARFFRYGVTGNFVVDPDWEEHDFHAMWDLVERLRLTRVGYTIMTPLPGTPLFDEMQRRIVERDWSKYDMHHILYEPKLGRRRFFDLFTQSWRRNVMSPSFTWRSWLGWMREVKLSQMWLLANTIHRAQRLLSVDAYLSEAFPLQIPAGMGPCAVASEAATCGAAAGEAAAGAKPASAPSKAHAVSDQALS
jgi:radical SAM superfamily enzyme YgiQ (UPF0313 family)